jgi:hypothetical protein
MKAIMRMDEWMALEDIERFKKVYRYLYEIKTPSDRTKEESAKI